MRTSYSFSKDSIGIMEKEYVTMHKECYSNTPNPDYPKMIP